MTWAPDAGALASPTAELARTSVSLCGPPVCRRAQALVGATLAVTVDGAPALPVRAQAGRRNAALPSQRTVFRRFRMSKCMEYARARLFLPRRRISSDLAFDERPAESVYPP